MQISFLSFSTFAGFRSLDDKKELSLPSVVKSYSHQNVAFASLYGRGSIPIGTEVNLPYGMVP